jgi:hypothetical protein
MNFKFDRDRHEYTLGGQRIISNTEILAAEGLSDFSMVAPQQLRVAQMVGTDIHDATCLLDDGKNWRKRYAQYEGYVAGWQLFKKEFKFRPLLREYSTYDIGRRIATTLDAWGDSSLGQITVEIKTGQLEDHFGLQLAFQEYCVRTWYLGKPLTLESTPDRWGIRLNQDGTYEARPYRDINDLRVFFSMATSVMWRRAHGYLDRRS